METKRRPTVASVFSKRIFIQYKAQKKNIIMDSMKLI